MKVTFNYKAAGNPESFKITYEAESLAEAEMHLWLDFYNGKLQFKPISRKNANILQIESCSICRQKCSFSKEKEAKRKVK